MKYLALLILLLSPSLAFAAIANTGSNVSALAAGSQTLATAISGSSPFLVVGAYASDPTGTTTTATYNGTAMTRIADVTPSPGNYVMSCFYVANPPAGTHDIVVSGPAGSYAIVEATYSGVAGGLDTSTSKAVSSNATSITTNITTNVDNDWLVTVGNYESNATGGSGTNYVERARSGNWTIGDSNADVTPAGATSTTVPTNNGRNGTCVLALSPTATTRPPAISNAYWW